VLISFFELLEEDDDTYLLLNRMAHGHPMIVMTIKSLLHLTLPKTVLYTVLNTRGMLFAFNLAEA
jgi:hypothetical protein